MKIENERITHPSFGMVKFARVNGGNRKFFGSALTHDHYIQLEIDRGSVKTDLGKDWYSDGENIIRVRMTSTQFSELITSLNYGVGVPCTIETMQGVKQEDLPPMPTPKETSANEQSEVNRAFITEMKSMNERAKILIGKKTLSNNDQKELLWYFGKALQQLESNIPFYEKSFVKRMDKIVLDAKHEIEDAIQAKIIKAGLDKLGISSNSDSIKLIDNN